MNKKVLTIAIIFLSLINFSIFSKQILLKFRLYADFWALPFYYESSYKMYGSSFNGSFMAAAVINNFTIGGEIFDDYFSLNELESGTGYKGAWNILRGTADFCYQPVNWFELKTGVGAAWLGSAFSKDAFGTVGRHEPGVSFVLNLKFNQVWKYIDFKLINLFDLFITESYLHPSYYGAVRYCFHPYLKFIDLYMETGVLVWVYNGKPADVTTTLFIWSVGISLDMTPKEDYIELRDNIVLSKKLTIEKKAEVVKKVEPVIKIEPEVKKEEPAAIEKLKAAQAGDTVEFNNIIFLPDNAFIKEESFNVLNKIADILIQRSEINIEILGHTNDIGKPSREIVLSKNRAEKVKEFLVNKGVDSKRIICSGCGSVYNKNKPIDEANRKVEIRISGTKKL